MPENSNPIISQITTLAMILGVIITAVIFGGLGALFWVPWAVCVGALFLCEYLFGRRKKRFYKNIGAFIGTVIMAGLFVLSLTTDIANDPEREKNLFIITEECYYIMFLPPMIASLGVNIGNIIYKVRSGKAGRSSDQLVSLDTKRRT